jgi:hypothetical protein
MESPSPLEGERTSRTNLYEVRPAAEGGGFLLVSDRLSTGRMHFSKEHVAVGYAMLHSGSNGCAIRVYNAVGELTASHSQPATQNRKSVA